VDSRGGALQVPIEFEELLSKSGVSLASLGISDVGLLRSDALRAVEILRRGGVPILGGDVYLKRGERIEVAYANWHIDPEAGEDRESYSKRTWDRTEAYLAKFPNSNGATELFAIVIER
jgi:hypothetical protein